MSELSDRLTDLYRNGPKGFWRDDVRAAATIVAEHERHVALNAELDEFPSFAEVQEMGDRLAPLADYLDALGFDNDAELIRRIIDPHSTVANLRHEHAELLNVYRLLLDTIGHPRRLREWERSDQWVSDEMSEWFDLLADQVERGWTDER